MMQTFSGLTAYYTQAKNVLSEETGITEDLLHVHAGLLIFVLSTLLLRRKMRSAIPLALVYFFAILNEGVDRLSYNAQTPMEPWLDILNTVFWPTFLFLVARKGR
ncbi:hypothetical protein [Altericroceibacterium xinjiangense]|uniref:hypothetical protein n=1 Tax=Altericroceibacterium xinjiangense TaxID=762261 RepID=UPI000F7F71C6|nr:hypothetical protein [Altericroceibacterium xinjiangense]